MSLCTTKPRRYLFPLHSLTFTSWACPETNCFYSFQDHSGPLFMKTSKFLTNYTKSACFTNVPKCSDQQSKFQIQFSSGNYSPKHTIFYIYMGTPSKVTHTKYAVAETRISGVRLITVICILKLFYNPC